MQTVDFQDAVLDLLHVLTERYPRCILCSFPYGPEDRCETPYCRVGRVWGALDEELTRSSRCGDASPGTPGGAPGTDRREG